MLCHLSLIIGFGLILPLVVYLAMRRESAYVTANARGALNFHLSLYLYFLGSAVLCLILIGYPLLILLGLFSVIISIVAAVKASRDEVFHYPITIPFVR